MQPKGWFDFWFTEVPLRMNNTRTVDMPLRRLSIIFKCQTIEFQIIQMCLVCRKPTYKYACIRTASVWFLQWNFQTPPPVPSELNPRALHLRFKSISQHSYEQYPVNLETRNISNFHLKFNQFNSTQTALDSICARQFDFIFTVRLVRLAWLEPNSFDRYIGFHLQTKVVTQLPESVDKTLLDTHVQTYLRRNLLICASQHSIQYWGLKLGKEIIA